MPTTEAQKRASKKYIEKLDEFKLRMPAGTKERWRASAEERGTSVNQLVYNAVEEYIKP